MMVRATAARIATGRLDVFRVSPLPGRLRLWRAAGRALHTERRQRSTEEQAAQHNSSERSLEHFALRPRPKTAPFGALGSRSDG